MLEKAKLAVKELLHRQGYRFERLPESAEPNSFPATSGKIVEFIGPSGVGKTSTFHSVATEIQDRWFFQEHLAQYRSNAFTLDVSGQSIYERLVEKRAAEVLDQEAPMPERVARLAYLLKLATEDMALVSRSYSRGFFIHDGFCQNFLSVLVQLLEQGDPEAEQLIRTRAFIILLADDADFVVENILSRRKNSPHFRTNNFLNLDRRELRRLCSDHDTESRRMLDLLSRKRCKRLVLHAEHGLAANVREIRNFEQTLVHGG